MELTHPQIIKLTNYFLKLGWNLYANVLVETGLKAALVRKRGPIVTTRSILVVSQSGFTSLKLGCLLFKLFLTSLEKPKNNTLHKTYAPTYDPLSVNHSYYIPKLSLKLLELLITIIFMIQRQTTCIHSHITSVLT